MPEGEDLDPTPAIVGDGAAPEITVRSSDDLEVPRDLRLKPLLAVVAVIVVAAATVWWVANRGPRGTVSEPTVVVEDLPAPEPSQEALEKPAQEPAGKPLEVSEAKLESPPVREMPKPAARILDVEVSAITDETLLTVRANSVLSLDSIRVARLKDPARVWVRIQGIETFYRPNLIEVGTTEVERVRIGHHPEETPQSLYVVLDLADSASGVRDYTVEGDTLRVAVGRPEQ
jgi:hypothetical protein